MKKIMVLVTAALGMAEALCAAQMATSFAYQGCVLNSDTRQPLTGNQSVTISLYDAQKDGKQLWSSKFQVFAASNGTFNVEVSDTAGTKLTTSSLSEVLSAGEARYLGLKVNDYSEIIPRQKVLAVPSAVYAQNVSMANGDFTVGGTLIAKGTIDVGDDYSFSSDGQIVCRSVKALEGSADSQTVNNDLSVGRSMKVSNNATVGGTLSVTGNVSSAGSASFGGALSAGGNLTVGGTTVSAANAAVTVKSLAVTSDKFTVNGASVGLPVGTIVMWHGEKSKRPDGWEICDGENGTPDLRDRFILGAGRSYNWKTTGGEATVRLETNHLPPHSHRYAGDDNLDKGGGIKDSYHGGYDADSDNDGNAYYYRTEETGGHEAHNNMPPYYALYFIMKVR